MDLHDKLKELEDKANRSAEFLAQTTDDELPAVRIDEVLVFVYFKDGDLHVTVDCNDSPYTSFGVVFTRAA